MKTDTISNINEISDNFALAIIKEIQKQSIKRQDIKEINILDRNIIATKAVIMIISKNVNDLSIIEGRLLKNQMFTELRDTYNKSLDCIRNLMFYCKRVITKEAFIDIIIQGFENGEQTDNYTAYEVFKHAGLDVKTNATEENIRQTPIMCLWLEKNLTNILERSECDTYGKLVDCINANRDKWYEVNKRLTDLGVTKANKIEQKLIEKNLIITREALEEEKSKAEELAEIRRQRKIVREVIGEKAVELFDIGLPLHIIRTLKRNNIDNIEALINKVEGHGKYWYETNLTGIGVTKAILIEKALKDNNLISEIDYTYKNKKRK